jgi:hypothetical protein
MTDEFGPEAYLATHTHLTRPQTPSLLILIVKLLVVVYCKLSIIERAYIKHK